MGENVFVTINPELPELHQPEQAVCPIGLEVLTDSGNKAGTVVDYLFDVRTGTVIHYLFKSSGWRGVLDGIYLLPVAAISTIGSKRAIVSEAAVSEPQLYAEGLHKKVGLVAEFLHEDFDRTLKNVAGVKRDAQSLAEKFQDKALEVRDVAQEKVAELKRQRHESAPRQSRIRSHPTRICAEVLPFGIALETNCRSHFWGEQRARKVDLYFRCRRLRRSRSEFQ